MGVKKIPRGLSISRSQANLLRTVFLDDIVGSNKSDLQPVKLDYIEQILIELATLFKVTAENGLSVIDAVNTGKLADSIQFDEVEHNGNIYSVKISVLDYYQYINKGVGGVKGGNSNSPFKFKNLYVSKKMMQAIRKWVIREGLKVRVKPAKKKPLGQEKRGHTFKDVNKTSALAYAIATNIKKHGIKSTSFWDNAESAAVKELQNSGNAFAIAVITALTSKK